jgi:hypothetical protein
MGRACLPLMEGKRELRDAGRALRCGNPTGLLTKVSSAFPPVLYS